MTTNRKQQFRWSGVALEDRYGGLNQSINRLHDVMIDLRQAASVARSANQINTHEGSLTVPFSRDIVSDIEQLSKKVSQRIDELTQERNRLENVIRQRMRNGRANGYDAGPRQKSAAAKRQAKPPMRRPDRPVRKAVDKELVAKLYELRGECDTASNAISGVQSMADRMLRGARDPHIARIVQIASKAQSAVFELNNAISSAYEAEHDRDWQPPRGLH